MHRRVKVSPYASGPLESLSMVLIGLRDTLSHRLPTTAVQVQSDDRLTLSTAAQKGLAN